MAKREPITLENGQDTLADDPASGEVPPPVKTLEEAEQQRAATIEKMEQKSQALNQAHLARTAELIEQNAALMEKVSEQAFGQQLNSEIDELVDKVNQDLDVAMKRIGDELSKINQHIQTATSNASGSGGGSGSAQ